MKDLPRDIKAMMIKIPIGQTPKTIASYYGMKEIDYDAMAKAIKIKVLVEDYPEDVAMLDACFPEVTDTSLRAKILCFCRAHLLKEDLDKVARERSL